MYIDICFDKGFLLFKDLNEVPLEGDITVPGTSTEEEDGLSTLDEPVRETIVSMITFVLNIVWGVVCVT